MKQFLGLVIGLCVGGAGAFLFQKSMPPEEGSLAESLELARRSLKEARQKVAALEAEAGPSRRGSGSFRDRARAIAEDIKAGREVSVDDVFNSFKPVMRDLAPLFDRLRLREEKQALDAMANALSRKYGLSAPQQASLEKWIENRAKLNAEDFNAVFASETTTLRDMVRVTQEQRRDEGLDQFMEGVLEGEALDRFREDRMLERVERVQEEADRNTTRLDNIVALDESQKDQVFAIMARGSRDFDPAMQFGGLGGETGPLEPGRSRGDAIDGVLRPEQRETLQDYRDEKRRTAEDDLRAIGLSLPEGWDVYDEIGF